MEPQKQASRPEGGLLEITHWSLALYFFVGRAPIFGGGSKGTVDPLSTPSSEKTLTPVIDDSGSDLQAHIPGHARRSHPVMA